VLSATFPFSDATESLSSQDRAAIFVVEDESRVRAAIAGLLESVGNRVETYSSAEEFLQSYHRTSANTECCLLVDSRMGGMSGLDLLLRLQREGRSLPAIMITGHGDIKMAVEAMKAGAKDFLEKPVGPAELLAAVDRVLNQAGVSSPGHDEHKATAAARFGDLSEREQQILDQVLAGHPNKNIAADFGISRRTVEAHRATIMRKVGAKSLAELIQLAIAAKG
jgi:two-component system CheB/CheR fusion protein